MDAQSWIILGFLVVANVTLIVSEVIKRRNKKQDIADLRRKKEAEMVARAGAESLETLTDEALEDEIELKQVHIWILAIVVCLDIWILGAVATHWWAATYFVQSSEEAAEAASLNTTESIETIRGLFGDSFGAVTALVSALAFAGMIVAYWLQRHELRLQRHELRDSRNEMRRQTTQFKTQNSNLECQRFENTFFNMLDLHKQNLKEIDVQGVKGRDAIVMLLDQLKRLYDAVEKATTEIRDKSLVGVLGSEAPHETISKWNIDKVKQFNIKFAYGLFFYGWDFHITHDKTDETRIVESAVLKYASDSIKDAYRHIMNSEKQGVSSYLGHYFRHMYQTVCFVDKHKQLKTKEKYSYVKMLRAQMSDYEQILFYYNAMSSMGKTWTEIGPDNLSLIIRYKLIKNVPHFYSYFFNEPQAQFIKEISIWKEQHPKNHFFEQIAQLDD